MLSSQRIDAASDALRAALESSGLPVADLTEPGRIFYRFDAPDGVVGYGGYELYGAEALLRSVVVVAEQRGKGLGRELTEQMLALAHAAGARRAFLLTETARGFFEASGFSPIDRATAPNPILETRQAKTICSSATMLMRVLND